MIPTATGAAHLLLCVWIFAVSLYDDTIVIYHNDNLNVKDPIFKIAIGFYILHNCFNMLWKALKSYSK